METQREQYWSMTEGVFNCLIDQKRSLAFKKAIKNTVKEGDVVVDMGTGSGILAMFAARAGAKKVYAVEIDENNICALVKTFEQNNLEKIITIIHSDVTKVKIPEKVDVIIGEMIATGLIEELQVPAMNNLLKYSKKDVKILLNTYETFVDVVHNNEEYYGQQFKIIRYEYPDLSQLKSDSFSKKYSIDKVDFSEKKTNLYIKKNFNIKITKAGTINGIRISGKTTFFDNSTLGATFAYDYPIILPIENQIVEKNKILSVSIAYKISGGLSSLSYSIK